MPFPAFLKKKKAADKIAGKFDKKGKKGKKPMMDEEETFEPKAKFGKAKDQLASLGG